MYLLTNRDIVNSIAITTEKFSLYCETYGLICNDPKDPHEWEDVSLVGWTDYGQTPVIYLKDGEVFIIKQVSEWTQPQNIKIEDSLFLSGHKVH